MRSGEPSHTARGAAAHRAAHQRLEGGVIFTDRFAERMLDAEALTRLDAFAADPTQRPMRLFIAARSRFSEDSLAACVAGGTRQVVVLGAGLDTFALRNPHAGVRVFEVDYPATQDWKRQRLAQADIAVPPWLTFAPVDFERQSLADGLMAVGFDRTQSTFFQWLGVSMYLSRETLAATFGFIAGLPDSEVVFDYGEPLENFPEDRRVQLTVLAERTARAGEPWLSLFDRAGIAALLQDNGMAVVEDLGAAELAARFYASIPYQVEGIAGPHVVRARSCANRDMVSGPSHTDRS